MLLHIYSFLCLSRVPLCGYTISYSALPFAGVVTSNNLISVNLNFLICKMGMLSPTAQDHCEINKRLLMENSH